jgi:hypothetical protein
MDPSAEFCPHSACRDKGLRGHGNIGVHSQREHRYRCRSCSVLPARYHPGQASAQAKTRFYPTSR